MCLRKWFELQQERAGGSRVSARSGGHGQSFSESVCE